MADLMWLFPDKPRKPNIRWEWPMACYVGSFHRHAAYILCEDDYTESCAKNGSHAPLGVVILRYTNQLNGDMKPHRMLSDLRFLTLREAIQFTEQHIANHPEWQPKIL